MGETRRPNNTYKASPAPSITTGVADMNGGKLYYELLGAGHPLVLIHSEGLDHRLWDDQFFAFSELYQVIRYDLPGYGKSERPKEPDTSAGDLCRLLRNLGIKRTIVLGLSMGGAIALDFALEYPHMVDALVLTASGLGGYTPPHFAELLRQRVSPLLPALQEAAKTGDYSRLIDSLMADPPIAAASAVMRQHLQDILTDNASAFLNPPRSGLLQSPAARQRLSEIHVPTLIIIGDKDDADFQEIADLLAANIAGARKITIPGAFHLVNMEQPAEFNRVVLDFLSTV